MKIKNKVLSLISSCVLIANLALKPINSISTAKIFGRSFAIGAVAPVLCAVPIFPMSISDSIKEGSKGIHGFLNILKRNSNTLLRIIKWSAAMWAALSAALVIYNYPPKDKDIGRDNNFCVPVISLGVSSGVYFTSWIGQKLTEDKEKTQKNDALKTIKSNEKEITK